MADKVGHHKAVVDSMEVCVDSIPVVGDNLEVFADYIHEVHTVVVAEDADKSVVDTVAAVVAADNMAAVEIEPLTVERLIPEFFRPFVPVQKT